MPIDRRTLMKTGAATGTGAAAVGGQLPGRMDPVQRSSALALTTVAAAGVAFAAGAVAYHTVQEFTSSPDDDNKVTSALAWEDHVRAYELAKSEHNEVKPVLAGLRREAQTTETKARQDAIYKVYDVAKSGGTKSSAKTEAENAVKDVYSTVLKSLATSWENHLLKMWNHLNSASYDGITSDTGVHEVANSWGGETYDTITGDPYNMEDMYVPNNKITKTVTLPNGNSLDVSVVNDFTNTQSDTAAGIIIDPFIVGESYEYNSNGEMKLGVQYENFVDKVAVVKPDSADYSGISQDQEPSGDKFETWINTKEWYDTWTTILGKKDEVISQVDTIVDGQWDTATNENVDLTQWAGPGYASNLASDPKDFEDAITAMEILGYPIADTGTVVSVLVDPQNSTWEDYDGKLAWVGHSGSTLNVGTEYDTASTPGTIYFAYNYDDENGNLQADLIELSTKFEILDTGDGSDEVAFESRELPEADTNPTQTREIMQQVKDAIDEAENNTKETVVKDSGGGGGFLNFGGGGILSGGIPTVAILGGAGYLVYDTFLND